MKCLKKFLALGMCAGVMSTSSCSAILPDEVMKFYLSTGIDNVILKSQEGLSAICYFLNGGYGLQLTNCTAYEQYLSQVYEQATTNNGDLVALRNHLAAHLEGIRNEASNSFKIAIGLRAMDYFLISLDGQESFDFDDPKDWLGIEKCSFEAFC